MTNRVRKTIDECPGTPAKIMIEALFIVMALDPEISPTSEELMEFITPDIGTRMLS
jgi:hypothetical protein